MLYPKSFGIIFVWYVYTLGWTGGIVFESAKNRLAPKYQSGRMYWMYQMRSIAFAFCRNKVTHTHTHIHTHAHKCSLIFDMCGLINFVGMLFGSAKTELIPKSQLIYSNITCIFLARVNFCTLLNNVSYLSKHEHIPYTHETKWFGITHSFIKCIIIYCS